MRILSPEVAASTAAWIVAKSSGTWNSLPRARGAVSRPISGHAKLALEVMNDLIIMLSPVTAWALAPDCGHHETPSHCLFMSKKESAKWQRLPNPSTAVQILAVRNSFPRATQALNVTKTVPRHQDHAAKRWRESAKLLDCVSPLALSMAMPCPRVKRHQAPRCRANFLRARAALIV